MFSSNSGGGISSSPFEFGLFCRKFLLGSTISSSVDFWHEKLLISLFSCCFAELTELAKNDCGLFVKVGLSIRPGSLEGPAIREGLELKVFFVYERKQCYNKNLNFTVPVLRYLGNGGHAVWQG